MSHAAYIETIYPEGSDAWVRVKRRRTEPAKVPGLVWKISDLLQILSPINDLKQQPTDSQCVAIRAWVIKSMKMASKRSPIMDALKRWNAHADIIKCFTSTLDPDRTHKSYIAFQSKYKHKLALATFVNYVDQLLCLGPDRPVDKYADISPESALTYCTGHVNVSHKLRMDILMFYGYQRGDELATKILTVEKHQLRFKNIIRPKLPSVCAGETLRKSGGFVRYKELLVAFDGSFDGLTSMSTEDIRTRLLTVDTHRTTAFRLLQLELQERKCGHVVKELENLLGYLYTGISAYYRLTRRSVWLSTFIDDCINFESKQSQGRTAFPKKKRKQLESQICIQLSHMDLFITKAYAERVGDQEPLQWFFDNATFVDVKSWMDDYIATRKVNNSMVKSACESHHAAPPLTAALRFLKGCFKDHFQCSEQIAGLDYTHILNSIDNKRVPANIMRRRMYKDSEVNAMFENVSDPVEALLLGLLREVGLRKSCLCHLQYSMLLDDVHTPRDICIVPEKGKKMRQFVTSSNIKRLIKLYSDFIRKEHAVQDCRDFYIFNPRHPDTICSGSNIGYILKAIGKRAGITDVVVHAHAFRHTIVGKLMDAGNSLDVVSKFMGHASALTTAKNYWVTNIKDLTNNMSNPFTAGNKKAEAKEKEGANELLQRKLTKSLELINLYNTLIAKCMQDNDAPASEVKRRLFEAVPNLQDLLSLIADTGSIYTGSECSEAVDYDDNAS